MKLLMWNFLAGASGQMRFHPLVRKPLRSECLSVAQIVTTKAANILAVWIA
jgi:hypothetical protein